MKTNTKVFLFSVAVYAALVTTLALFGWIQRPLAIHIAHIHVWTHHLDKGYFFYYDAEFVPVMGHYGVYFKNGSGEILGIAVSPYEFPFRVSYDSIDSPL